MVRQTLKILQQMLQDFKSMSDHFTTLRIKGLTIKLPEPTTSKGLILHINKTYNSLKSFTS